MSVFGKIFGSKKPDAPTTQDSLQKLQETEDLLMKKQDFLEGKIRDVSDYYCHIVYKSTIFLFLGDCDGQKAWHTK
jgi:hypothetical protein